MNHAKVTSTVFSVLLRVPVSSAAEPAKEAPLAVALSYLTSDTRAPVAVVPVKDAPLTATSVPAKVKLNLSPVNVGAEA